MKVYLTDSQQYDSIDVVYESGAGRFLSHFHEQRRLRRVWPQGGGEGRGTLIFSAYVGSDPASTVHPKKISGISNTPKKYLKF